MTTIVGPDGRPHFVYTISGVRVEFPAKAYPSQIAMMDKVIRGLQRGQHCLLESPTGSGKTLALLCASLAWQRTEAENVRKFNEAVEATARANLKAPIQSVVSTNQVKTEVKEERVEDVSAYFSEDSSDDDFQPTKRKKMSTSPAETPHRAAQMTPRLAAKFEDKMMACGDDTLETSPVEQQFVQRKQKIPKIFFGTRTHKQITQVVKEFRRTVYSKTPMGVLASREHTCIHPEVSRSSNKNEGCKTLNDPRLARQNQQKNPGCSYRHRGREKLKSQNQLRNYGVESGWDIEDLVGLGRKLRVCPYYATRDLMEQAQIIFSPYNYLIDPKVRQAMRIPIDDNVIILDEAHNIEDCARESAGGTFSQEDFRLAFHDCEKIGGRHATMGKEIETLAGFASYMMGWIDRQAKNMKTVGFDREVNIMTGTEFVAALSVDGFGPERLIELKTMVDYIFNEQVESEWAVDKGSQEDQEPQLSAATQSVLEGFLMIMNLMLGMNQVHRDDYRAVVERTVERKQKKAFFGKANLSSQWTYALNLWCLNPAVVLKEVRESTRSIVVTSGTLSPLGSYQTELDIDFKITLEANHVIPANRVWIGSIANGPRNVLLNGTFRTTSTFEYQDELGRLVLGVSQTIPHGVLCFLPSYSLLEKLVARWQDTGLWQHLSTFKTIVCESRDSSAFEETLRSFYSAIEESQNALNVPFSALDDSGDNNECPSKKVDGPSGALMLAVCRGKVSEGLDFTDNNARAVICVGIPFPNFKDTQVELKREYNDKKSASTQLLKGSEWYEIQAFRALNQALGRCIRHKADWGAILLVDDRFAKIPRYVNQLSKWVRTSVRHYNLCEPMMTSLKLFTENFVAEDAVALAASKQQLIQSLQDTEIPQLPMPVTSSPYFVKPKIERLENESPEVISIDLSLDDDSLMSDDVENSPKIVPHQEGEKKVLQIPAQSLLSSNNKPLANIIGNPNKMSMSQRMLAAESGSHYFPSMNATSAKIKSETDLQDTV